LPIKKGDKVGILEVYKNNELEKSIDLIAMNNVTSIFDSITKNIFLNNIIKIILCLFVLTFILLVIYKIIKRKKRKNRIYSKKRRRKKY
ncbi:MAG TPA: D-alanyl-D-alanine carboxypeptidase, partial [Romboutsia timonensis]|nr:D-alanyl-D-alanine carboxypeptidase [Romboutsia timonensis]